MKTSQKIISYLKKNGQASGKELSDFLEITDRAVRKQLKSLLEQGKVCKIGTPPKVFYKMNEVKKISKKFTLDGTVVDGRIKRYIDKNYLFISPAGERKNGWEGFVYWCSKTGQKTGKAADDYFKTMKKYDTFVDKNGLIEGTEKLKKTFSKIYLDQLFYISFYSIERFGKTKLGQLLLYAKQSQNKKMMKEISQVVSSKANILLKKFKIDGVGFIPPTVKRNVQLMKELQKITKLPVRNLTILKIKSGITVPQKTLNKINDRVENAQKTFAIEKETPYKNILLIDDAVGSGSTFNEVAKKIREKNICKGKIIGLAITGSFKGFDVISEV